MLLPRCASARSSPLAAASAAVFRQRRSSRGSQRWCASADLGTSTGKDSSQVWDKQAQQFHGGQDWAHLTNFVEDFSVTTNPLGTPAKALERARAAIDTIHHYPPADFEPAISDLARWLWPDGNGPGLGPEALADGRGRLLLGNGASELIDLVIRDHVPPAAAGDARCWKPGADYGLQYKEYERSAQAAGFTVVPHDDVSASVTCFVNPNNPTGEYFSVEEVKARIEQNCMPGSHVIVDESMQPWVGPHWRKDSLLSQSEWIAWMLKEHGTHIFLMHSWTKIWSCTGVRLGSVIAPSREVLQRIKMKQVPWSVNTMALEFLSEVVHDDDYMQKTWEVTPVWRQHTIEEIVARFPSWQVQGKPFLSYIWVDVGDVGMVEEAVRLAKQAGTPVRSGAPGYNMPHMIRIAVREPQHLALLLDAWEPLQKR